MARGAGKRTKKRRQARGRFTLPALLIVLALSLGLLGYMEACGHIACLRPAEVYFSDLPEALDGTTIVYLSDLNISGTGDARACARLVSRLAELEPDLLILGGDILIDGADAACLAPLYRALEDYPARLGRFAAEGETDATLDAALSGAGVELLCGEAVRVERNGAALGIAGLSAEDAACQALASGFSQEDFVIALAHDPADYSAVRVAEAKDGGAWADLVLSGHTLGGQIVVAGRTLRALPEGQASRRAGWYYVDDLPLLVSQGVGCRGANLRLGTQCEVWLLTLRRAASEMVLPDLTDGA